jgi:uncharacterized protein (DUF1015 family)
MAHIEPFRALRYDPAKVPLAQVATQPYDKITPEMQERYYSASPYNLVRIILGKRSANDGPKDNSYTRAAALFQTWREQNLFLRDLEPSLYRYTQQFSPPISGMQFERRGFIGLGKLEDYSAGVVFRHEQTLAKPKADRLDLLRATRAHFEQIFMLYSDPLEEIERALETAELPIIELTDEYRVIHRVWRVSDPASVAFVRSKMDAKKLIIADGHHRYETSLNYRNERRQEAETRGEASDSGSTPYEFTMMTFVNMEGPGLLILPTHRVIHGLPKFSAESFRDAACAYFGVEEVDNSITAERATAILREAGRTGTALLAIADKRSFLLSRPRAADSTFEGLSVRQQSLDVVQLHKCILEGVLGISAEAIRDQQNVIYVRNTGEAMNIVRAGQANLALLMNAVHMRQVRDLAFAGEVLPQKSTDFYPKLLSGLTVYALE